MILFRQDWVNDVNMMRQEMGKLLDHLAGVKPPSIRFSPTVWEPAIDIYETEDELIVIVELAGVQESDIQVTIHQNIFTIRGERKKSLLTGKSGVYHQMEISSGPFERSIELPRPVNADYARASYENGLLEVVLPKIKTAFKVGIRVK